MNRLVLAVLALLGATVLAAAQSVSPIAPVPSTAAESSHVFKNKSGYLYSLSAQIGGTAGYVMLFDATSAPADGSVTPTYCWQLPANGVLALSWSSPVPFAKGVVAVFSSTGCTTKTASATAFFTAQVQ